MELDKGTDEFSDEESEDEEDAAAPQVNTELPEEVRKHMDRQSRRIAKLQRELAQSQLTARYGEKIAGLIPEELPTAKWEAFADKLAGELKAAASEPQNEQQTEEGSEKEPTEAERRMAAVVASGSSQTTSAAGRVTWNDYRAMLADPATHVKAMQLRKAGMVDESTYPSP